MKATLTFQNRRDATLFAAAWNKRTRRGWILSATEDDGTTLVEIFGVTPEEKKWVDEYVAIHS